MRTDFTKAGLVAWANRGSKDVNSNGSQFFINLGFNSQRNGKFNIFGEVLFGMGVVKLIEE